MRKIKYINKNRFSYRKILQLSEIELRKNTKQDLIDFIQKLEEACWYYEDALRIIVSKNFIIRLDNGDKMLVKPNDITNGPHELARWVLDRNLHGMLNHSMRAS